MERGDLSPLSMGGGAARLAVSTPPAPRRGTIAPMNRRTPYNLPTYFTLSSSISKISVSFGPMTGGKPRSP